jgi:transcriptional regulator with XRE-family HTH domain
METLGRRIRRIRASGHPHRTQQQLASFLGVKQSTVSRWETDQDRPGDESLARLLELTDEYRSVAELRDGCARSGVGSAEPARRGTSGGEGAPEPGWIRIDEAGRLPLPREIMDALGLRPGDSLALQVDDDGLRIRSLRSLVAEAQAIVRRYVPKSASLVDELIAERRREASRE